MIEARQIARSIANMAVELYRTAPSAERAKEISKLLHDAVDEPLTRLLRNWTGKGGRWDPKRVEAEEKARQAEIERQRKIDADVEKVRLQNAERMAAPAPPEEDEDDEPGLYGSSVMPPVFRLQNGAEIQLGEVVAEAHRNSGISPKQWNELPEETRELLIRQVAEQLPLLEPLPQGAGAAPAPPEEDEEATP